MSKFVTVSLSDEHETETDQDKDALLDRDLDKFSEFLKSLSNKWINSPLIPQERAIIKSYLIWKIAKEK